MEPTRIRRPHGPWRQRALLLLTLLTVLLLGIAGSAQAGTAFRDGSVVRYAGDAVADNVTVTIFADRVEIVDIDNVTAGSGCSSPGGTVGPFANCDIVGVTAVVVDAGAGNDQVKCHSWQGTLLLPCTVNGQDGDDNLYSDTRANLTLNGGPGDDQLLGSRDGDTLNGGADDDLLRAGDGADLLDGGAGDDVLQPAFESIFVPADAGDLIGGGDGIDTVTYHSQPDPLVVTLDGVANDGRVGKNDNVLTDVENVIGGDGGDTITGSAGPNVLYGGGSPAADVLDGAGGADVLRSSRGDTLRGGPGDDIFDQDIVQAPALFYTAHETLEGGTGDDTADYGARFAAVTVDTDDQADDGDPTVYTVVGAPGPESEADNVRPDVEHVIGTPLGDVLTAAWMTGGAGADRLLDRPGAQRFSGGEGRDLVSYAARTVGIDVDADGAADDDGAAGEGDTVDADVEDLTGGTGDDSLTGNALRNVLDGGIGGDELRGLGDADTVDYSSRTASVSVDLADATALDGEVDEYDSVGDDVEYVLGGAGDDVLAGSAAANILQGNGGDDLLDGAGGADTMLGGPGTDAVSYTARTARVVASPDGLGDDGEAGEGDTIATDVEDLFGGAGPDRLVGIASDNLLDGGPGADELVGGPGFDIVSYVSRSAAVAADPDGALGDDGQAGEGDTIATDVEDLFGGSGNDALTGSAGENFLLGGPGGDRLDGLGGEDALFGGDGDDDLTTRDDSADLARCDAGNDLVRPDARDTVVACERRDDGAAPPPPPPPPVAADRRAPTVRITFGSRRLRTALRRGLRVTVRCSEPCTLNGRLLLTSAQARRLRLSSRIVARGSGRAVARSRTLVVRFTAAARRRLARQRSVKATFRLVAKDAAGNARTVNVRVTLRR